MYHQLQMDKKKDFGAKYPQEREGVQGGELPISIKPKSISYLFLLALLRMVLLVLLL
jgi:hypothetical protein